MIRARLDFPPASFPWGIVPEPDGGCVLVHGMDTNFGTLERRDPSGAIVASYHVPIPARVHHAYGDTYLLERWKHATSSALMFVKFGSPGEIFETAGPVFRVENDLWFSAQSTTWTLYRATPEGNEARTGFLSMAQPIVGGSARRLVDDRGTIYDAHGRVVVVNPEPTFAEYAGPSATGAAVFSWRTGVPREMTKTFYRLEDGDERIPIAHAPKDETVSVLHRFRVAGDLLLRRIHNFTGLQTLQRITEDGKIVWETKPAQRIPNVVPFDEPEGGCGEIPVRIHVDGETSRLEWLDAATSIPQ
jgi:hypothetical protein